MICRLQSNRVWRAYFGGARIDMFYGVLDSENSNFPEDWVASTVKAHNPGRNLENEGLSKTQDGIFLKDIIKENPSKILGSKQIEKYGSNMSILVKLLDASERLVIQVHPTANFAKKYFNSDFGKTECWYIIDAAEDAHVYLGFKKVITKEKWIDCFEKQDKEAMLNLLHRISVKKGDCIFVDGALPHAIGGGCMMVELQEPTDLMVIPERETPSGMVLSEQKLHCGLGFDKMFDCFEYQGYTKEEVLEKYRIKPQIKSESVTILINEEITNKFIMEELTTKGEVITNWKGKYAVAIVLEGCGKICEGNNMYEVKKGDQMFISADSQEIKWKFCEGQQLRVILCFPA